MKFARLLVFLALFAALPGCYVKTYGLQTSGGGTNATVVSTQTATTAGFSNGRASFSFGQPVSPAAPGGQVTTGRGGGLVIAAGLVIVEALQTMGDWIKAPPVAQRGSGSIMETCSCYAPAKRED